MVVVSVVAAVVVVALLAVAETVVTAAVVVLAATAAVVLLLGTAVELSLCEWQQPRRRASSSDTLPPVMMNIADRMYVEARHWPLSHWKCDDNCDTSCCGDTYPVSTYDMSYAHIASMITSSLH